MTRTWFLAAVGLLVVTAIPAAGQGLRTVPLDHWSYDVADALIRRNPELGNQIWLANRPWREADFATLWKAAALPGITADERSAGWLDLLAREYELGAGLERIAENLYHNEVSATWEGHTRGQDTSFDPAFAAPLIGDDVGDPGSRGILGHDFAAQFKDNVILRWRYVADSNIRNDPRRRTKLGLRETEAAAFEVLDAHVGAQLGPVLMTFGRGELAWGPGRGTSPWIAESIPALDQFRIEVGDRDGRQVVRYTGAIAQLSRERANRLLNEKGNTIEGSMVPDSLPVPFDITRWLYLQRVDWKINRSSQVAISSAALVTGVSRGLELRFANPMLPFLATQTERDEVDSNDVNVMVAVEGTYSGFENTRLYGMAVVQELFIDSDLRDEIGDQIAWRIGAELGRPLGVEGAAVGAEYTRVDVFTYLHRGLNTNWSTFGVPLGSSLGPDADVISAWLDYWWGPALRFGLNVQRRRGGERSISTLENVVGAGKPDFPSGVVQREWRTGAEAWGLSPNRRIEAKAWIARRAVDNIGNVDGVDDSFWEAGIGLSYRFQFVN